MADITRDALGSLLIENLKTKLELGTATAGEQAITARILLLSGWSLDAGDAATLGKHLPNLPSPADLDRMESEEEDLGVLPISRRSKVG